MKRYLLPTLSGVALALSVLPATPAWAATYTVPAGVYALDVTLSGGGGGGGGWDNGAPGGAGGAGATVKARIAVTPGQVVTYTEGQGGGKGDEFYCTTGPSLGGAAGTGDGAGGQGGPVNCILPPAATAFSGEGGGGGGASSISVGGTVIRAGGGGGGSGGSAQWAGGAGGNATGLVQTAACAAAGAGQDGQGGSTTIDGGGGGGGGGSYNGGAGTGGASGEDENLPPSGHSSTSGSGGASCYYSSAANPILATPAPISIVTGPAGGVGGERLVREPTSGAGGSVAFAPVYNATSTSTAVPALGNGALAALGMLLAALAVSALRRGRV